MPEHPIRPIETEEEHLDYWPSQWLIGLALALIGAAIILGLVTA